MKRSTLHLVLLGMAVTGAFTAPSRSHAAFFAAMGCFLLVLIALHWLEDKE